MGFYIVVKITILINFSCLKRKALFMKQNMPQLNRDVKEKHWLCATPSISSHRDSTVLDTNSGKPLEAYMKRYKDTLLHPTKMSLHIFEIKTTWHLVCLCTIFHCESQED